SYVPSFFFHIFVLFQIFIFQMVKPCFHVSSISSFLSCLFVSTFFVNSLVSLPFPRPDQIDILLALKNEFPILKCPESPDSEQVTRSWTSKDVNSFDRVTFDDKTGVVTELHLRGAGLCGSLSANSSLFRLHHLRYLDLSFNYFDSFSFLPELGKLTNLESLDLSDMGLAGEIPSSISSLNRLTNLYLYGNELIGSFSPLLNLSKLSYLDLSSNHFSGNVPCSLLTMPFLSSLHLSQNHLIDSLETMNCSSSSKLEDLDLSNNRLSGRILEPLSKLTNLKLLDLSFQNTTDPINFVSSLGFKSLELLNLSGNSISRLNPGSPNLSMLYLDNCSINEFPTFIKNLQNLERSQKMLLNSSLSTLDLRSNAFRGHLLVVSATLGIMLASNNSFTGDIPLSLCNKRYLSILDLAHNNFSGSIPRCLITSVEHLDLRNNNLIGRLPDIFDIACPITILDGNRIEDTFPFWLKDLPYLKVMVLRSNKFHGPIYSPRHPISSPQLRIIDISRNQFTGSLPHDYFSNWSEPLISIPQEEKGLLYMDDGYDYGYYPSMYLRNKGINMELKKILLTYTIGGQPKSSFEGNLNLCGLPLEESCFSDKVSSTPEAQKPEQVLNWKAAAIGYGPGVLFGLVIGQVLYSYKPVLFYKLFRL
ncbi:unnamed protein product, partial [Brassica oleracea]